MERTAVIVVSDLMFQPRIETAARAAGLSVRVATPAAVAADPGDPALVVVDLHEREGDALAAIRTAKAAGAPVLAFGRHTDAAALRAAREAGADVVVPRSQLVDELPDLIRKLTAAGATAADTKPAG
jgi:DNA-binding NarL/FixJ family response regulator